eukprot:5627949-Prorocentrum_lima.AAC.1
MTSSLVGSEMCIRDSTLHQPPFGAIPVTYAASQASNWLVSMGTYASPVSYTHLTLPTICSV